MQLQLDQNKQLGYMQLMKSGTISIQVRHHGQLRFDAKKLDEVYTVYQHCLNKLTTDAAAALPLLAYTVLLMEQPIGKEELLY